MSPTSYRTAPPRAKDTTMRPTRLGSQIRNRKSQMPLVGLGRVELPTSRLSGVRSNQLSYSPISLPRHPDAKKSHTSLRSAVRYYGGRAKGPCSFGGQKNACDLRSCQIVK